MKKKQDVGIYLQLIQEPICRMSTASAVLKGFSATVVAGIAAASLNQDGILPLLLSIMLVSGFASLDVYYLRLERQFRYLFEKVRSGEHPINFSLRVSSRPIDLIEAQARIVDCLRSPSIYLFYPMVLLVPVLIIVLKMIGVE